MSTKTLKTTYYITTGLITALMLMSAGMYFLKHDDAVIVFNNLGYPTYIIYPLAVAKTLGLIVIWTRKSNTLKEWAYAGFFFDLVLATTTHYMLADNGYLLTAAGAVIVLISYVAQKKAFVNAS